MLDLVCRKQDHSNGCKLQDASKRLKQLQSEVEAATKEGGGNGGIEGIRSRTQTTRKVLNRIKVVVKSFLKVCDTV